MFSTTLPCSFIFEKIADKWVLLILNVLEEETQHFNLLKKNIQGISPKVLSQKLKMLERDGFIERKIQNTSPYSCWLLTNFTGTKCRFNGVQLKEWAETNIEQVLAAQMTYDEKVLEQA